MEKLRICSIIIFIISSVCCNSSVQMPENKNFSLEIALDSVISTYEQWVYMWHYEGNEFIIDDSVFVEKGERKIKLYGYTDKERGFNIVFSKKGPIEWYAIFGPNTNAYVELSDTDAILSPSKEIKGASAHNERMHNVNLSYQLNSQIRDLSAQLSIPNLSGTKKDSIQYVIMNIEQQLDAIPLEMILHSASSYNVYSGLTTLKGKISRDSLITLCKIAQKRFPENKDIDRLLHNRKIVWSEESEQSKILARNINAIKQKRLNAELMGGKSSVQSTQTTKISDISLQSDKGDLIAIDNLAGEYILIDFWASWCIPCIEGLPYIRQAKKMYGDKLTVCMVSMDKKHNMWIKSIDKEKLNSFINLNVYDELGQMNEDVQALGIESIPYNVLLDKQHRIVVTDLHQKELLDKLHELLN